MKLGEKIRYLRSMEGAIRGLSREMTQAEVARAMSKELRKNVSQSYLSQIENGTRPFARSSAMAASSASRRKRHRSSLGKTQRLRAGKPAKTIAFRTL